MSASEAKQEVKQEPPKDLVRQQVQNQTDLASFNSFGVATLEDGQEVNIQITTRHGIPFDRAYEDLKSHVNLLNHAAKDMGIKFWNGQRKESSYTSAATQAQLTQTPSGGNGQDKPKRNYKDPIPQGELPEELAHLNEDVFMADFDLFKVLPQPDSKANVEFWKDGLEFPVGAKMNKWKHEAIKQALANLTEQAIDPSVAAEYRIAGNQYWVKGNEFIIQQGAHKGEKSNYKNIVLLKPIF